MVRERVLVKTSMRAGTGSGSGGFEQPDGDVRREALGVAADPAGELGDAVELGLPETQSSAVV
ncbi:hypothetical protein SALBM217S_01928 [Streptomyces griseoloalbus]